MCFTIMSQQQGLEITLEFGGGAELLFGNLKKHQVTLPACEGKWTIRSLLTWMKDNLLKERPELFIQGETVRPGILVLVNDADWELLNCHILFLAPISDPQASGTLALPCVPSPSRGVQRMAQRAFLVLLVVSALGACACQRQYDYQYPPTQYPIYSYTQPPSVPLSVQPYALSPNQKREAQHVQQHTQQPARQPTYQEMVEAVIARGVTRLAINLAKVVEHDGDVSGQTGNVVFSPLNVATALALVLAGSNGTTFNEIANALGIKKFGHFLSQLESGSATVNPTSNTTEGSHVVVANGLFVQKEYDIQPSFAEIAASYRSQVIPVDFMNDNTRTKDQINNWFSKHTLGRIKSVLPESPPRETKLMIASALYFNGAWEAPFPIEATMVRPFNGVTVNGSRELSAVRMMTNNMDLPYAADHTLGVRLLELPYKTRDTSMFLLLPDADGLAALREVERRLHEDPGILERLIETRKVAPVIYTLPRMKLQRSISLRTALETLGVHTLFDERHADLSHLSDKVVTRGPLPPPAAA
ncbi:hypothetical protein FOCC_FOCC016767, partial [Frankliniella occidentalis]